MEYIQLAIHENHDFYMLTLNSKVKLRVESITFNVLSIDEKTNKNRIVYIDVAKNEFYKTKNIGAYLNVIYINDIFFSEAEGPHTEIRLSLICLTPDYIRHIFIKGKKLLSSR